MSGPETMTAGERRRAKREWVLKIVLLGGITVLLVLFLAPTANRITAGLRYPYQMDKEEGFVLWQAWQLRHGHNIFRPLNSPPYVAATYGPLYPLVSAAFLWGKTPSFFGGRLIAALSVIAICFFMAGIIWRETGQALAALLGPLLFLNSYEVYQWLPFYRVDFSALALGMAGLWLLSSDARADGEDEQAARSRKRRWRVACACFVAMVYTRQVELAPLLAALIYFFLTDRPAGWRLLRNVAGWGLGIAAVLTLLTRGQFLVHNIYYNANEFSAWQLKTVLVGRTLENGRFIGGHFYLFNRFLTVALLVSLAWFVLERFAPHANEPPAEPATNGGRDEWGHLSLFALYAVVASIGILGLGKTGAAMNYLIEPRAAWALFIALVVGRTIRPSPATGRVFGRRPIFFPVAIVLLLHAFEFVCSSTVFPAFGPYLLGMESGRGPARLIQQPAIRSYILTRPQVLLSRENRNPNRRDVINGDQVVEALRQARGPVFCEQPIFPMLVGQDIYIQPFIMSELAREGKWDQTPAIKAIRQKHFALLVTTEDIVKEGFFFSYTDEMVAAIREAYRLSETMGGPPTEPPIFTHYLFEPRPPSRFEKPK